MKIQLQIDNFKMTNWKKPNIEIIISEERLIDISKDILNSYDGKILFDNVTKSVKFNLLIESIYCTILDKLICSFRNNFIEDKQKIFEDVSFLRKEK